MQTSTPLATLRCSVQLTVWRHLNTVAACSLYVSPKVSPRRNLYYRATAPPRQLPVPIDPGTPSRSPSGLFARLAVSSVRALVRLWARVCTPALRTCQLPCSCGGTEAHVEVRGWITTTSHDAHVSHFSWVCVAARSAWGVFQARVVRESSPSSSCAVAAAAMRQQRF